MVNTEILMRLNRASLNLLAPKVTVASHFWMFIEHVGEGGVGSPSTFKRIRHLSQNIRAMVMAPENFYLFKINHNDRLLNH